MTRLSQTPSEGNRPEPGASADSAVAVATINQVLKDVVEGAFMPLWVRGEISDFKRHRNGHWYYTLRDATSQLRCVTWSRDQKKIPAPPDDGMQVTVFGQLTVYAARGDVQMSVRLIEAEGDGLWRKALEQTRQRLEADGLLDPLRKRPLPSRPRRIAVVTSPSGAALHDIIHVVKRRSPDTSIVLIPARVQGDGAAEELVAALERFARWGSADVLIIGRGGGAREDLWSFNHESVARALAACPVPTISAVGHEVDSTICDLVADFRAATPSAAAEAAVPDSIDMSGRLRSHAATLRRTIGFLLRSRRSEIANLGNSLPRSASRMVQARDVTVRTLAGRINDMSPLAVLARGYGIAQRSDGHTMASVTDFVADSEFTLRLMDGRVAARTTAILAATEESKNVV